MTIEYKHHEKTNELNVEGNEILHDHGQNVPFTTSNGWCQKHEVLNYSQDVGKQHYSEEMEQSCHRPADGLAAGSEVS